MRTVIGIALGAMVAASLAFQIWQLHRFINAGPRFTAADGQALCERVAALEQPPMPCHYDDKTMMLKSSTIKLRDRHEQESTN